MDLTGQSEGGDVYFGMAFFLSLPFIFFVFFNLSFSVLSFWRIFTLSHVCLFIPLSKLPVSEYREPAIASQVCFQAPAWMFSLIFYFSFVRFGAVKWYSLFLIERKSEIYRGPN